ncbi:hypothetical protein AMK59_7990 [Oryctes borbonicus]|uniref:ADP-ribosylhydrolase ARH3 n=1 Tax=Oryctes borbonicus TaxID=1629725 RepID=A0A0T6ASM6_9SCAR|nr:hypothetical protein AMK59_7990 [Oryctes borbonicus]
MVPTKNKQYTDDTAMTKSMARCLIDKPPMDFKYLANLFVKEYFSEPRRGYGQGVTEVFHKLRNSKFQDVYGPAREQFNGTGSYGNGGAMRMCPIPLFFHNNYEAMIEAATNATKITHTHSLGIHGALLQCIAIHQSLLMEPHEKANHQLYTKKLIEKMKAIETDDIHDLEDPTPYQTQLKKVAQLLSIETPGKPISEDEVVALLGNSIAALHSVPTGIYCYLKAQNHIPGIDTDNPFRRTIQYAISLGGDTDTIAAMAGSIAGAHYGEEMIGENLRKHCEFVNNMIEIADELYRVTPKT